MDIKKRLQEWWHGSTPLVITLVILIVIAAIIWLLPGRTAAVLIGIIAAAIIRLTLLKNAPRTHTALLWMGIGVISDAAYARLNDIGPVTIANALMKVVDAIVKLIEPMARSVFLLPPDFRARLGAATPEFVWSFILALVVMLAYDGFIRSGKYAGR